MFKFVIMEYREFAPDRKLSPFIECYWSAVADRPPFQDQEALIPDGTIELMFNFGDSYQYLSGGGWSDVNRGHIIGIRRKALYISQANKQDFFCVRFKPGGTFPFFRIPAHHFADIILRVDELLPYEYSMLEGRLFERNEPKSRVDLLNVFFLKKLKDIPVSWTTTQRFVALSQQGVFKIQDLDFHYKTLERHFKTTAGLSPEHYLKIRRFNQAVKIMYSGKFSSLTEVAYDAGYYDQSHFIRDFKRFSGQTPLQFLKSKFKIVEVIQPALADRLSKSYNFKD